MHILYLKALHIIFVITWFAGLFYSVRLFIYYAEAEDKEEPSKSILQIQYKIMSKRLWYIITWPSAILASLFAFWMLYLNPYYLSEPWMLVKLSFVFALYLYHAICQKIYQQQQNGIVKYSSFKLEDLERSSYYIAICDCISRRIKKCNFMDLGRVWYCIVWYSINVEYKTL